MPGGVLHELYFHVVWKTIGRHPVIVGAARQGIVEAVREEARNRKAVILACNAMPDHVHLLVRIGPVDLGKFVGEVKGASAHRFNLEFEGTHEVKWQKGYGIVSMRAPETIKVTR